MENQNIDIGNNLLEENIFKLSYKNQNVKKSNEYKIWIKKMNIKFNNLGKEIICNKDNLIIYSIYDSNSKYIRCPICNSEIYGCIYCNKSGNRTNMKCCTKAYFKYYIKDKIKPLDKKIWPEIYSLIICFFIPLSFSSLFTFGFMGRLFFDFTEEYDDDYQDFMESMKALCENIIFKISLCLVEFIFACIYAIFIQIFFLVLFILSIPFKLYPFMILLKWLLPK